MQARPRPTGGEAQPRPLDRREAEALIAVRLADLGHPPDLLHAQAVALLVAHAGGSARALRTALASTLFLASTEDETLIGPALVQRALQGTEPTAPAPVARPAVQAPLRRTLAAMLAAGAVLLPSSTRQPAPPTPLPVSRLEPPRVPPIAAPSRPKLPRPPVLPPTPAPRPAPVLAPEQVVRTPAVPPDTLPAGPLPKVLLLFPSRGLTAGRAADLVRRLHANGFGQVDIGPGSATRARRPVSYFFIDDLPLAQTAGRVLAEAGLSFVERNSLDPRLVLVPRGLPARQPGLIEIQLP